jgi:hypothetical protein
MTNHAKGVLLVLLEFIGLLELLGLLGFIEFIGFIGLYLHTTVILISIYSNHFISYNNHDSHGNKMNSDLMALNLFG